MAKISEQEAAAPEIPAEEGDGTKKSGLIPKLAIGLGAVLVLTAASFFLQKTFLFNNAAVGEANAEVKKEAKHKEKEGEEMQVVMLDEIVVNPAETGGRRYLVVTLGLQTAAPEAEKAIEKYKPLIRDALISLLSAKHLDELSRISYRDTLRGELKEATNRQVHGLTIENVVFSSYVLQ